jgi:hypothetical protein
MREVNAMWKRVLLLLAFIATLICLYKIASMRGPLNPRVESLIALGARINFALEDGEIVDVWLLKSDVTDDDLAAVQLEQCKSLAQLVLGSSRFTNKSVASVVKCKSLTVLVVYGTEIDEAGIDAIHAELPKCSVYYIDKQGGKLLKSYQP